MSVFVPIMKKGVAVGCYIVDAEDVGQLSYSWHLNNGGYLCRNRRGGKTRTMHRIIMGLHKGDRVRVDHINRVRTDNRRCNLRVVEWDRSAQNIGARKTNTTGYRGVSRVSNSPKWRARVGVGPGNYIGVFDTPQEAAMAAANRRRELGYLGEEGASS